LEGSSNEVDVWRAQGALRAFREFENIFVKIDEVNIGE